MKATVQARSAEGIYSVRTESNMLLVFALKGSEFLAVGDTVEVDLPSVLSTQQIVRVKDNRTIGVRLNPNDIHDLKVPAEHGTSRTPKRHGF